MAAAERLVVVRLRAAARVEADYGGAERGRHLRRRVQADDGDSYQKFSINALLDEA